MNELIEQLEKSIKLAKYKLKEFDDEKLSTEEGNINYNRLLIKKAVMMEHLKNIKNKKHTNSIKKIWRKMTGKKLICDSF